MLIQRLPQKKNFKHNERYRVKRFKVFTVEFFFYTDDRKSNKKNKYLSNKDDVV